MRSVLKYPLVFIPNNLIDSFKYKNESECLNLTIQHENTLLYIGIANVKFVDPNGDLTTYLKEASNLKYNNVTNSVPNKYSEYNYGQKVFNTVVESPDPEMYRFEDVNTLLSPLQSNETNIISDWQENTALVQLLSAPGDKETPKQRKTIIFSGSDATHGQTIQKINVIDPNVQCCNTKLCDTSDIIVGTSSSSSASSNTNTKKIHCDNCDRTFEDNPSYKQHLPKHKVIRNYNKTQNEPFTLESDIEHAELKVLKECLTCKKTFKIQDKYLTHLEGHGNPDRECFICHKVLSSKSSLTNHKKTHNRRHRCEFCTKSFNKKSALETHTTKMHRDNTCYICLHVFPNLTDLRDHVLEHERENNINDINFEALLQEPPIASEMDDDFCLQQFMEVQNEEIVETIKDFSVNDNTILNENIINEKNFDIKMLSLDDLIQSGVTDTTVRDVDSTITLNTTSTQENGDTFSCSLGEVSIVDYWDPLEDMSAEDILTSLGSVSAMDDTSSASRTNSFKVKKYSKICTVCGKGFDRKSDLKRHSIEHIVRVARRRNQVTEEGQLHFNCGLCDAVFNEVDKYKAHLRSHTNLTIYECTFCNKSFSDSSNFSKHKKVHSKSYFQCDLCNRKFNSKNMIARHMDYHEKTPPLVCTICRKVYHFQSTFNKHMKFSHSLSPRSKYRCKVCDLAFTSLRQKWDHEWDKHKIRKTVVDCTICGSKFRKFTDLKRHSNCEHNVAITNSRSYFSDGVRCSFAEKMELDEMSDY